MSVLARAPGDRLASLWSQFGPEPDHKMVRGPETGLVMLRGRIGGTGGLFNVGEASVTRATVRLADGCVGHSVALGRDRRKARIAALVDALCLDADLAARIDEQVVAPLATHIAALDDRLRCQTAATRVDFFTLARGED